MKDTLDMIFNNLNTNYMDPLINGMQGLFPKLVWVAALIAIIVLLCSSFSGRVKAGGVILVLLVAILWPYVPTLINGALGEDLPTGIAQTTQSAQTQIPDVKPAPAPEVSTLGTLDA